MERTGCPTEDELEAIAADLPADEWALRHIESCATCRRLLDEVRENNQFLGTLAKALAATRAHAPIGEPPETPPLAPDSIPGYTIGEEIHRGGHGIVYHAIQLRTKRRVAIKVLLRGATATRRQRQRLEHEAEIIASLQHPGIVTVYDGHYFEDGRYGFAMEYIDGKTLDRWAGDGGATSREQILARLRLFSAICDAVAFAHRHGVIHRDLKPANILIDDQDNPHILDFGIAKALQLESDPAHDVGSERPGDGGTSKAFGAPFVTLPGEFAGTPAYASPEQVSGDPGTIDTRTDVYSLGVILYLLMTGKPPYPCTGSLSEVVHHIEHTVPSAPSRTSHRVDADIDAIVLRALEKDKERRYASVSALQNDVQRYLAGGAIEARSNSAWYVLRKSVRRHRTSATIACAVVLLLAAFAGTMTLLYAQKRDAEATALGQLRLRELLHGRSEAGAGRHALGADLIWRAHLHPTIATDTPQRTLFGGAIEPLDSYWGLWELYSMHPRVATADAHEGEIYDIAISPDRSAIATGGDDGALRVWSFPGLRLLAEHVHGSPVVSVRFSGDGRTLGAFTNEGEDYFVFDGVSGEKLASFGSVVEGVRRVRLNDDGSAAKATGWRGGVHFISLDDAPNARRVPTGPGFAESVVFSRDGALLATSMVEDAELDNVRSTVSVWTLPELELAAQIVRPRTVSALLFARDGGSVLWATNLAEIERWDHARGSDPVGVGIATSGIMQMLWIGDDERRLITLDKDHTVRLIDLSNAEPVREVGRSSRVFRLLHRANEPAMLVSGLIDGQLTVSQIDSQPYQLIRRGDHRGCHAVAISPDNRTLAYAGGVEGGYGIVLIPLAGGGRVELAGHTEMVSAIAFSPDGRSLASASFDGTAALWDAADGSLLRRFADHTGRVSTVAFSPDSDTLASAGDGGVVLVRNLTSGSVLTLNTHADRIPAIAFHPDGRRLASGGTDGAVRLWDIATGELLSEFIPGGGKIIRTVCFSPDGAILASGGDDNAIVLKHLASGRRETLRAHPAGVLALAFEPEGRVLVSGDRFGGVMLWDVQQRRQIASLPKHPELMMSIAVSPDGMRLATGSAGSDPEVRLWDLDAYHPHIAGNLEHHARIVTEALGHEPPNLAAMRAWAAEVMGQR